MNTKREWTYQLAAVCVLALWLASGCANKTNVAEGEQVDGYSESTQEVADGSVDAASSSTDEFASTESTDATEAELFGENTESEAFASETVSNDATADSLFQETTQDPNAAQDPALTELTGRTDGGPTDPGAGGDPLMPYSDPAADPLAAASTEVASADPLAAAGLMDPAATDDSQAFGSDASFESKPAPTYSGAVLPNIPGSAISRKGANLNRFYFLRAGDNSNNVAELVYGTASKASDLKKWNKGRWIPGKVVYYTSPTQAEDSQMISLYDERNLTPEEHTVARGESMSSIAKNKLGSLSSWKELAVTNGLSSPDTLSRGQVIKIYTDLNGAPLVAQAPEAVAPPPVIAPPPVQAPVAAQPPSMPQDLAGVAPGMNDPMATENLATPRKKPKKEGLNAMKLLANNALSLAMGLGIGLLLISLMMISRRKRSGGGTMDDFNEDAFAAPGKKKRR